MKTPTPKTNTYKTPYHYVETTDPEPICQSWFEDITIAALIGQGIGKLIVIVNFVLRMLMIKIIMFIGYDTESAQMKAIKNGVFVVQFVNTGILLLMVSADASQTLPYLGAIFAGRFPDFTSEWYNTTGNSLVAAMQFNIYWPIIEFFVFFGLRYLFRLLDGGCSGGAKTKATTI